MTAVELKALLDKIDWASLPQSELSACRATLSVAEAKVNHILYCRKFASTHFPKKESKV